MTLRAGRFETSVCAGSPSGAVRGRERWTDTGAIHPRADSIGGTRPRMRRRQCWSPRGSFHVKHAAHISTARGGTSFGPAIRNIDPSRRCFTWNTDVDKSGRPPRAGLLAPPLRVGALRPVRCGRPGTPLPTRREWSGVIAPPSTGPDSRPVRLGWPPAAAGGAPVAEASEPSRSLRQDTTPG